MREESHSKLVVTKTIHLECIIEQSLTLNTTCTIATSHLEIATMAPAQGSKTLNSTLEGTFPTIYLSIASTAAQRLFLISSLHV